MEEAVWFVAMVPFVWWWSSLSSCTLFGAPQDDVRVYQRLVSRDTATRTLTCGGRPCEDRPLKYPMLPVSFHRFGPPARPCAVARLPTWREPRWKVRAQRRNRYR